MYKKIRILSIVLIVMMVLITLCLRAGRWLVKIDEPVKADIIVILMGSVPDRILQANDLYGSGFASRLLMVETRDYKSFERNYKGEYYESNTVESCNLLMDLGIPGDSIIVLQGAANSTFKEALITRDYFYNNSYADTVLLVSSAEHMRRASIIFKSVYRKAGLPVYFVCSPSKYSDFNAVKWWKRKKDSRLVVTEYLKLAYFFFIHNREE